MALAEANVRVTLEVSKFERDLRQKVQAAANRAARDFDREMKSQMAATGRNAGRDFANAARTSMARAGRDGARDFDVNFRTGLSQTAGRAGQRLGQGLRVQVSRAGIEAGRGFRDNLTDVLTASGAGTARAFITALTTGLTAGATRAGTRAGDAISVSAVRSAAKAGRDAGRDFSINFGLGSTRASRPLVTALAVAGSAIVQGLRPATGILATVPGLLLIAASTASIAATAFVGMGDAIKAVNDGDIDKLAESMARLSPAARAFVREFASVRPVLRELQADIQDAFFTELQGQARALAAVFSGPLRQSIVDVSTSTGQLARQVTQAFTDMRGVDNLETSLRGTSRFIDRLGPGVRDLLDGFLAFTAATAPGLNDVGRELANLLSRMGDWMAASAQSGQALAWVEGGIAGLKELSATLSDIGSVFLTIAAAARPLTFALSGIAEIAFAISDAFASLPGPIQTALLAAVLFSRSGLPEFVRRTTRETRPLTTSLVAMGDAYRTASTRVQGFLTGTGAVGRAAGALGRSLDRATDSTVRFATSTATAVDQGLTRTSRSLQTGFIRSTLEADAAVRRTTRSLQTGFIRSTLEADAAVRRTTRSLQTGFIRAGIETDRVLGRISDSAAAARDTLRQGLVPAALAVDSQVTRTQAALSRFGGALQARVANAADSVTEAFARMNTSIHTGVIRSTLAAQSTMERFGSTMRSTVLRPLVDAQTAYRVTSGAARDFTAAQAALNSRMGTTPTLLARVRTGFSEMAAITQGTGSALRSLATGPVTVLHGGLSRLGGGLRDLGGMAAGAGAALARGLGSAVSGLVGALGGPWGLAIAGAGIALALFAGRQEEAKRAAAEHDAAIARLADTLNRQTGAVTQSTFELKAKELAERDLINSAKAAGISADDFTRAALNQGDALSRVTERLKANTTEAIRGSGFYQLYGDRLASIGVTLGDLQEVSLGNEQATQRVSRAILDNIDVVGLSTVNLQGYFNQLQTAAGGNKELADALGVSTADLEKAREAVSQQAAALTPAQIAALEYADALGILADNTADADAKARALNEALEILAGGTIDAEAAQGRFTELLQQLDETLVDNTKNLTGMGAALLTNTGRIDTTTTAGAYLIDTYTQLAESLSTTATATVEAGRANGDLNGALVRVAEQTQAARDQFVQTARQLGLTQQEANALADAYGLIPAQVLTTVTDQGSALNVQLQVAGVYQQLKDLPPNTPVTVRGLTQDAIDKLNEVGIKTRTLPDGSFRVVAETGSAVSSLQSLVNSWSGRVISFVASVIGGNAAGNIIGNAVGRIMAYADGGTHHLRRMPANRAEMVRPNTWRVIGDNARHDEAYIPINNSARSRALLTETARRMGYTLLGDGAILGNPAGRALNIAAGAIVINAPYADPGLVARATVNELARHAVA